MGTTLPSRGRAVIAAAVVLAIGLLVTLAIGRSVQTAEEDDAAERFEVSAEQTRRAIERATEGYFEELTGIGAYIAATPDATTEQFARFVDGSGIFNRLPSLVGIIYLAEVPPEDLDAYLAGARAVRGEGFALVPIGDRPEGRPHLVLSYYVPGSVDLDLPLGADVSPILSISDVIAVAGAEGAGAAGSFQDDPLLHEIAEETDYAPIDLLLDIDFFIGVPVYDDPSDEVEVGVDEPLGWLAAPVGEFDGVLEAALQGQPADLGVTLTANLTGQPGEDVIERVAEQPGNAGPLREAAYRSTDEFVVDGMSWSLTVWSAEEPPNHTLTLVVAGGLLASFLAALLVYARVRSADRDHYFAQELTEREAFRRAILDSVREPMVVLDGEGRIRSANPAWWELRGFEDEALEPDLGGEYVEILGQQARGGLEEIRAGFEGVATGDEHLEVDVPVDVGGGRRWFAVRMTPLRGRRGGAVVVHNDITERKRSEAELELKATHDDLTGLLNRSAFEDEVERALHRARLQETPLGVLFIDLDGFKPINDTHGHAVGDDVLRAVAQRITSAVRTSDRVARLGGDEFVVLVGPLNDPADAEVTAHRILEAFKQPVHVGLVTIRIKASIGVAVLDSPLGGSSQSLMELADRAMYTSKQAGGNRFSVGG